MNIYISGGMRGYPRCQFEVFDQAAALLRNEGHEVMSPADNDRELGFYGNETEDCTDTPNFPFREAFLKDMTFIGRDADAIVMLPHWEQSQGARLEHDYAVLLGLKIGLFFPYSQKVVWG